MAEDTKYYCYSDSGGTFTDAFVMSDTGQLFSGKASTTPESLDEGTLPR